MELDLCLYIYKHFGICLDGLVGLCENMCTLQVGTFMGE